MAAVKKVHSKTYPRPKKKRVLKLGVDEDRTAALIPLMDYPGADLQVVIVRQWQALMKWLGAGIVGKRFAVGFRVFAVLVLLATTLFWSLLSARLVQANADQFIDAYMFDSFATFQGSAFPGAHTFLLKWPVFALMALLGNTQAVFMATTVLMVLATVGVFAYILHRIERRPLVFAGLCLAMSTVLLLVPTEPYSGALLPANFAMSTTRNIEYIVLIVSIYCALRATKLRSWWFGAGVLVATLLIASDKLYMPLLIGGSLVAGVVYLLRRRQMVGYVAGRLLLMGLMATGFAAVVIRLINVSGLTHIVSETTASPFAVVDNIKQFADACIYAFMAALTNFGANPVHGVVVVRDLPGAFLNSVIQWSIIPYAVNLAIFALGLWAVLRVMLTPLRDIWSRLAVLLVGVTVVAFVIFVATDHYYPVDSRYVAIEFFALYVAAAVYGRTRQFGFRWGIVALSVLTLSIPLAAYSAWQSYQKDNVALAGRNAISRQVADALQSMDIHRLVGDYWYITPVKAVSTEKLTIAPVVSCGKPREVLNSAAWITKAELMKPAVYLAVRDSGDSTTYDGCSLSEISGHFGIPTSIIPLKDNPNVVLLVYKHGMTSPVASASSSVFKAKSPKYSALRVINRGNFCKNGTTLNIVAHQDDDLLFMSPDLLADVDTGRCMRTVYVTAGDAGGDLGYWYGREKGEMAAYARMLNAPNSWRQSYELLAGQRVSVQYLKDVPRVSLVFMHLPDGDIHGQGFASTGHESLKRLYDGSIGVITSVGGESSYNEPRLVAALLKVMNTDRPDLIRTQDSSIANSTDDHSDHRMVGYFTTLARSQYLRNNVFKTYQGYSQRFMPENIVDTELARKQEAFMEYAAHDGAVCQTVEACVYMNYGQFLTRQYVVDDIAPEQ